MAEAIGNAEIAARLGIPLDSMESAPIKAISAGLTAKPGASMTDEALRALGDLRVAVAGHASRSLTPELVGEAEIVYCMSSSHRDAVINMVPTAAEKTKCLDPEGDIADPTGSGPEAYEKCAARIQFLVCRLLDEAGVSASY
jgi:protein-tyrosine phosphatase